MKYYCKHFSVYLLYILFIGIYSSTPITSKIMLESINDASESTVDFEIGSTLFNPFRLTYYITADQAVENNNYAIALAVRGYRTLSPLAPPKIELNREADQDNPLHGCAIDKLALFGNNLLLTKQDKPDSLYFLDVSKDPELKLSYLENIYDAFGNKAPKILNFTTMVLGANNALQIPVAFAAVSNKDNKFDGDGSGIAAIYFRVTTNKDKAKEEKAKKDKEKNKENNSEQDPKNKDQTQEDKENNPEQEDNTPVEILFAGLDQYNTQRKYKAPKIQSINPADAPSPSSLANTSNPVNSTRSNFSADAANSTDFDSSISSQDPEHFADQANLDNSDPSANTTNITDIINTTNTNNFNNTNNSDISTNSLDALDSTIKYATPISLDSSFLAIGNALSYIGDSIDLHWDNNLELLLVALQVKAGSQDTDGARALCVGSFTPDHVLEFYPIAPDAVLDGSNSIISSQGSYAAVSLHKVRTLYTSTHLSYAVVVGGPGEPKQTKRSVYSLPLVSSKQAYHGCLAHVKANPGCKWNNEYPYRFNGIELNKPALTSKDAYNVDSIEAQVGAGKPLPGDINDISVKGDAVFVAIEKNDRASQAPGIFYSRALFDDTGIIKRWTEWQRAGVTEGVTQMGIDINLGTTWYIPSSNKKSVCTTSWSHGNTAIEERVRAAFPQKEGGVQAAFSLPYKQTRAIFNPSLSLVAGFNKIMILELNTENSSLQALDFKPIDFSIDLGSVTASHIYCDGVYNWLVVGGSKGAAVLCDNDGTGWLVDQPLTPTDLSTMSFKKITDMPYITKITSAGTKLYMLTKDKLTCKELNEGSIVDTKTEYLIAQAYTPQVFNHVYFTDFVATSDILILGTTQGLLTKNKASRVWKLVELPESVGSLDNIAPVSHLYSYTSTGFEEDLINSGNLYVINAYQGWHQSYVYRFAVNNQGINLFPDYYVKDERTFFTDLGNYYNSFLSDGAHILATHNRQEHVRFEELYGDIMTPFALPPRITIFPEIRSGYREIFKNLTLPEVLIDKNYKIGSLVRSLSSGSLLVAGDFGIRVNN